MKLSRDVTERHLRLLWAHLRPSPGLRKQRHLTFFLMFVPLTFGAWAVLVATFGRTPWLPIASPSLGFFISVLLGKYFDTHTERAFIVANAAELGQQEFWFAEDGFGNATPAGSTFHKWHAVSEVEAVAGMTIIKCRGHLYTLPTEPGDSEAMDFAEKLGAELRAERKR